MEQERYSYDYFIDGVVFIDTEHDHDMDMDTVCNLLNQQDKEIKQAKENLSKFGNIISEQDRKIKELKEDCVIYKSSINELYKAQKQLVIDELEKIKKFLIEKIAEKQSCFDSGCYNDFADGVKTICEILVWEIDKRVKILEEL